MDPAATFTVINCGPEFYVRPHLYEWLIGIGLAPAQIVHNRAQKCMAAAYNNGVKVALASRFDAFIIADADVMPQQSTALVDFLAAEADVVGAIYPTECEGAFDQPRDVIHTGLWRTSRRVLETIAPPWFAWQYTPDGSRLVGCLCEPFCRRVRAAGFTVQAAGWVGHKPRAG